MSESIYSETDSIFTTTGTFTSSSTIPGLGALSGKVIKRMGSAVVNGVDAILIRRRLAQLEVAFGPGSDRATTGTDDSLCSDLLELVRPVYSHSIRTRAFRLIMRQVGSMDMENLAAAVVQWPLAESCSLLNTMISCFSPLTLNDTLPDRTKAIYAAGRDTYKSSLPYDKDVFADHTAFLMFLGHLASLSPSSSLTRVLAEIDLLRFISDSEPPGSSNHRQTWYYAVEIVMKVLIDKIDPTLSPIILSEFRRQLEVVIIKRGTHSASSTPISSFDKSSQAALQSYILRLRRSVRDPSHQVPRILLLGAGESGKTTLMKQLCSFSDSEREDYREVIRSHVSELFYPFGAHVWATNYIPSDEEIMRCYIKTTGIHSQRKILRGHPVDIVDTGGQRSERKKWINVFGNVDVLIFVVAISAYDEVLSEDENVNSMQESLTLFDSVLILNKIDVFFEKITGGNSPLNYCFPEYTGGADYNSACNYLKNRFMSLDQRGQLPKEAGNGSLKVYFASFLDRDQPIEIMHDVYDTLLKPRAPESRIAIETPSSPSDPYEPMIDTSSTPITYNIDAENSGISPSNSEESLNLLLPERALPRATSQSRRWPQIWVERTVTYD